MKIKHIKIITLIEIIFTYISYIILVVILLIFSPELFESNGTWRVAFILGFSIFLAGAPFILFFMYNMAINHIKSNINHFRAFQKYCYKCGADISEMKKAETCPNCNTDLNFIEFLLELNF